MADRYREIREHFESVDGVTVAAGRGAQGLKIGKKMFAMFYKGDLVVKLSAARVDALISEGLAEPFDPGTGTPMKDRALIPSHRQTDWLDRCEEARVYATG